MGNTRSGRTISRNPQFTQWEAFDLCSPELREVLTTAVIEFDTAACYRYEKKNGTKAAIGWVQAGNRSEAQRAWFNGIGVKGRAGYRPGMENPCVTLGLKPLITSYAH